MASPLWQGAGVRTRQGANRGLRRLAAALALSGSCSPGLGGGAGPETASRAATASAAAALAANEQARFDSIEQTRPYVYADVVPGLAGLHTWDLGVANVGKSAARELTLDYDSWPAPMDDVATAVHEWFHHTPRTLPPGCSIRALWRPEGDFSDGTQEAGSLPTGAVFRFLHQPRPICPGVPR